MRTPRVGIVAVLQRFRGLVGWVLVTVLVAVSAPAAAEDLPEKPVSLPPFPDPCWQFKADSEVELKFNDVELSNLARVFSCWTGTQFEVPVYLQEEKVTLVSDQPVTVAEAHRLFLSLLLSKGCVLEPVASMRIVRKPPMER